MTDIAPDEIAPMHESCDCVSSWYHEYFRCPEKHIPRFYIQTSQDWERHHKLGRLECVLSRHHEVWFALTHSVYPGLWQAIFHDAQIFIRFLIQEPIRVKQQWTNRTDDMEPLRHKSMTYCNIAFTVLGELLRPGHYQYVFEEEMSQNDRKIIEGAKTKYHELYQAIRTRYFDPPWDQGGWDTAPGSTQDSDSGTIVGDGDDDVPAHEGQSKKDSGVGVDEKGKEEIQAARDNVEAAAENDQATAGQAEDENDTQDEASFYTAPEDTLEDEMQPINSFVDSALQQAEDNPELIGALFVAMAQLNGQLRQGQSRSS